MLRLGQLCSERVLRYYRGKAHGGPVQRRNFRLRSRRSRWRPVSSRCVVDLCVVSFVHLLLPFPPSPAMLRYADADEAGRWVHRPAKWTQDRHHSSGSDDESARSSGSDDDDSGEQETSNASHDSRRSSRASSEGTLEEVASSNAPSLPNTQPTTGRRSASPPDRASPASSPSPVFTTSAPTPPLVPRSNTSRPSTRGSPTLSAAASPASTAAAASADATAVTAHLNVAGSPIAPLAPRPPPKQSRVPGRNARRGLTPSQIAARAERKAAAASAEAKEEALAEAADVAELSRVVAAAKPAFIASTELSVEVDGLSAPSVASAVRASRRSLSSLPAPGAAASVPSSVSVLSRIDFLAASRAPVEDILSAKYNPDPADARAPDREKKLGYEVAYKEAREAAASSTDGSLDWLPYHLQGDSSLYHSQILVVRDSLQYHPRLTKWFSRYWHSFAHHVHVGFMSFREYEAMHLRITKVLFEKWGRKDAVALCRNDWRRDTRALPGVAVAITASAGSGGAASLRATAGTLMGYPHFSKSLFELVDLWTTTVDVEEYVDFLAILYARITAVTDREIAPGIIEAVEPLGDSPGGSPSAPTRHHADPAHAHNATAEERRKRARAAAALAEANRRKSGPLDLLAPSADDPAASAAASAPSLSHPASPVAEEPEESSLSAVGGEQYWAGFGFMFQTNVDQVRERKRARAEALAFEAEHGGSEALAALRREDDRRRLHADGSIDSGTSKILPMVDHRTLIGDGYKIDPEDTLTKRFPAPDFAKMREQQMLADAAEALEKQRAKEEAELAFGLASSRVLENMPLSDEQRAEKKAERLAAKAAEEEKRLAAKTAAVTALVAQAPPEIEKAAIKLAVDLMPSSSSSSESEVDDAKKTKKTAAAADSAVLPKCSPSLKKGIPSLEQPTGAFAASLTSKKIRAVLKPSPALVAARAKRDKKSDHRTDADWAAATAARQEESRRQIIDKAIAARRQIRVHKALQAAQRRLAEAKKVEARRLAELALKEERETDFFRQLDASISVADPSYVAPALPPVGRHRGRNSEFSSFDSSDVLPEGDEAAAIESSTPKGGRRSRQGSVNQRSRGPMSRSSSKRSLLRQSNLPESELDKLRADRARIEERKKQQRMEKAAAIAAGLEFASIDDDEPEQLSDDPALADVVEEEGGETGLRVGLAPVNESGAYDEYTPALQMQLSEEIAKLALLDANLRRSLPSTSMQAAGPQKLASIGSPRRGPQKLVTAAEMQAARQALIAASNRLKFLRKKALLSRKSGMENRAELRELADLEAKLEGRISKNGDILELSFLALAQQANHLTDAGADVTGNSTYTGFGVRSLQAPSSSDSGGGDPNWPASGGRNLRGVPGLGEEEAAKWKGDSQFWALRKRLARRRVLKYSAMAILTEVPSDEEKDEEQQRVLTIKLGAPTLAAHTGAATAAIGQRSSVISYKRTAIERLLMDDEAKQRSGGFVPFLGDETLNPELEFESRLLHRRHTSFSSSMGGGLGGSGRGSRAHFSRRRDRSDRSDSSSVRMEMSESTSNLLSMLTNQALEAAGTNRANTANAADKPVEPQDTRTGQVSDAAAAEQVPEPATSPSAPAASSSVSVSPSGVSLPTLHRGLVHKSAAQLRRTLSPPHSSSTVRRQSSLRSPAAQAEIEWNKELGLHHAMAQAVQDARRGGGGAGGGGVGAATQLMAFSPPRAPRSTHAQSAPTLHRGSATARLPKKQLRRVFAPPLHATAAIPEAPKLGVVAFGV